MIIHLEKSEGERGSEEDDDRRQFKYSGESDGAERRDPKGSGLRQSRISVNTDQN